MTRSLNLRAEPLAQRENEPVEIPQPFNLGGFLLGLVGRAPPRVDDKSAYLFSSHIFGDPATPVVETYLGDPLVIRSLVAATNDAHTFHLDGHWFRAEPWSKTSPPINTIHLGISERYDLVVPRAGGPQQRPGDYLFYDARDFKLREGTWGLLRVDGADAQTTLQKLPGHETIPQSAPAVCPNDAPLKSFDVDAIETRLPMLKGILGRIFVLHKDNPNHATDEAGQANVEPLVLHVNVGDCIWIHLTNTIADTSVSLNAQMLAFDPNQGYGIAAGNDAAQHVLPGATRDYVYYASPEVGETTALLRDGGDILHSPLLGLYGAIIVGPRGAQYTDPVTGADSSSDANWRTDVHTADGKTWRDFALFMQDEDPGIGTHRMPYTSEVAGVVGLNYQRASMAERLLDRKNALTLFDPVTFGMPTTPLLEAYAGDALRIHVLAPFSEQNQVFTVEDHSWEQEPGLRGTNQLSAVQVGAMEAVTLQIAHAGNGSAGDFIYGDHREPYQEAGLWGILRVYAEGAGEGLRELAR